MLSSFSEGLLILVTSVYFKGRIISSSKHILLLLFSLFFNPLQPRPLGSFCNRPWETSRSVKTAISIGKEHGDLNAIFNIFLWLCLFNVAAMTIHERFGPLIYHGSLSGRPLRYHFFLGKILSYVGSGRSVIPCLMEGFSMPN